MCDFAKKVVQQVQLVGGQVIKISTPCDFRNYTPIGLVGLLFWSKDLFQVDVHRPNVANLSLVQ
jgi:hypothetical protein